MLWGPAARADVENVAMPLLFKDEVPSAVAPSTKLTGPVGIVEDCELIVAVRVKFAEDELEANARFVFAVCTVCFIA
jgi:hypothetical protein